MKIEQTIENYEALWNDIVNNGNIDAINETNFTKDVTIIIAPENIVGIEAFKAFYQNYLTGFSEISFSINEAFGQDEKLVKHWTFKGKHTGEFFGMPATGKSVSLDGVTIAKMKDGKIAQEQDFMDNMSFMQQLGVVSDPNNVSTIDKLYKAFAIGDIPTVLSGLDAKVEWNEAEGNAMADGNPYIGHDAVVQGVFARLGAEHDYFKIKNLQLHEMSSNQVLATLRYDAKWKENGTLIDAQAAHHWTLKDGKVIAFQQYVDTRQLAEAANK